MPEPEDTTTATETDETTPTGQEPEEQAPTGEETGDDGTGDTSAEDAEADVDKLRATIARLRKENAKARTTAKETAAAEARAAALSEAEQNLTAALAARDQEWKTKAAKALGLVEDEPELTPEQVAQKIAEERDAARKDAETRAAEYAELLREVAVQDAANAHDAEASKLLDSRKFMAEVQKLDATDRAAFRAAVMAAVETAVADDASLKSTRKPPPPAASGGTTTAGSRTKQPEDMDVEELMDAKIHRRGY